MRDVVAIVLIVLFFVCYVGGVAIGCSLLIDIYKEKENIYKENKGERDYEAK